MPRIDRVQSATQHIFLVEATYSTGGVRRFLKMEVNLTPDEYAEDMNIDSLTAAKVAAKALEKIAADLRTMSDSDAL